MIGDKKIQSWNSHFVNGEGVESFLLIQAVDNGKLYCNVGDARYYMGAISNSDANMQPSFAFKEQGSMVFRFLSPARLYNIYGIKLVSWELSAPIVYNFN